MSGRLKAIAGHGGHTQDKTKNNRLLKVSEVISILRLGKSKVYEMIHTGDLPAYKLGGTYRIPESAIEVFLEASKVPHPGN